ncbi:N-acetylmuramoyl-L-alanine amidase [Paenibacillus tarimensis]
MATFRIALDAGHGPNTPGKRSPDGTLGEFQFNNAVAGYTADLLAVYDGVEILFTHAEDRDVPLATRTEVANGWEADIFVSIHANASGDAWSGMRGIETYVHTTRPAAAVKLANAVHRQLIRQTGLINRGIKSADFHVLRETKMTAILVECGFMTNREEVELLKSDAFRRTCAESIAAGIVETYGLSKTEDEQAQGNFIDVPVGHWAEQAIRKAAALGIINGIKSDVFGLGEPVTREQLAVILDRLGLLKEEK